MKEQISTMPTLSVAVPPASSVGDNIKFTLFVQGLPMLLDSAGLREFFSQFGEVLPSSRVIRDRGYGFVDFKTQEAAEAALQASLNRSSPLALNGLYLKVERAGNSPGGEAERGSSSTNSSEAGSSSPPSRASTLPRGNSSASLASSSRSKSYSSLAPLSLSPVSPSPSPSPAQRVVGRTRKPTPSHSFPASFASVTASGRVNETNKDRQTPPPIEEQAMPSDMATKEATIDSSSTVPIKNALAGSVQVRSLPSNVTAEDVKQVFEVFGATDGVSFEEQALDQNDGATLWRIRVVFKSEEDVLNAMTACGREGLPVTRAGSISENTLLVGSYSVAPDFMQTLESLSALGSVQSFEIVAYTTTCVIVFSDEESALKASETPVFLRGTKLEIVAKRKEE